MARPSLLTDELVEDVARVLPTVMYVEDVAAYLGVERTTMFRWIKRGRIESRRLARSQQAKPDPAEAPFLAFFNAVKRALAEGALCDLAVIRKAASGYRREAAVREVRHPDGSVETHTIFEYVEPVWQAAAWRLERRYPKRWGRRSQHQADANVTGTGPLFTFAEISVSQRRDALPPPEPDEPETPRLGHKEAES